jgi:hypothetical protein
MSYLKSENDLVVYLGKKEKSYHVNVYPQVKVIARKVKISPDIDLLKINTDSKEITGYEVKFLKYVKNWKRHNYFRIYEGIGESLCYFNYGVDKVYLIIGVDNTSVPYEYQKNVYEKLSNDIQTVFILLNLNNYLGLDVVEQKSDKLIHRFPMVTIKQKFPPFTDDIKFRKQTLFNGEFSWNKNLYKRIYS